MSVNKCLFSDFAIDDEQPEDVVMGEGSEYEYDTKLIFKHLYVSDGICLRMSGSPAAP